MSSLLVRVTVSSAFLLVAMLGCSNQAAMQEAVEKSDKANDESSTQEATSANAKTTAKEDGKLTVGMVAPPIEITQWIQGKPVEGFKSGHTYVVEFWATWCGPCLAGMPHISKLQELYQDDVTFIGVTREKEEVVTNFLEKAQDKESGETWKEVISYTLAIDSDSATNKAYMRAAGQDGIPCAFIVGPDSHIEWIGHPGRIDDPLEQVVTGKWDREEYLVRHEKEQRAARAMEAAMSALRNAQNEGNWDEALTSIDKLIEQQPEQGYFQMLKFSVLMRAERTGEAVKLAEAIVKDNENEPQLRNALAWELVASENSTEESLALALQLATEASEQTEHKDAAILDTLAKVYYEQGNLAEAIAWQEKAVEFGEGSEAIEATLKAYQSELEEIESPSESDEDATPEDEVPAEEEEAQEESTSEKESMQSDTEEGSAADSEEPE
ncbi:TlpA disulfide reductase family protein [Adhaeretor mobilis]|uniref:Thiol-disulfide oxidoreductase n=1 Tax=Adhaeretor mobilis TaxID=1930276 RepID=A0A517MQN8_9BACT|nr:TlpA disulfide reductase family protein [Adhaeretor mobilis]QDS97184.1 thiol-disulfide oxidoreductase [Adhaeretor mobilis]